MPTEAVGTAPLVLSALHALADADGTGIAGCGGNCPTGDAGGDQPADDQHAVGTIAPEFDVGTMIAQATPAEPAIDYSYPHSVAEIAATFGLSEARVSGIIKKAQARAKIMLLRRGYSLQDITDRLSPGVLYQTNRPTRSRFSSD